MLLSALAVIAIAPRSADAHEKWFHNAEAYPTRWEEAIQVPGIVGVAVGVGLTALVGLAWRARGRRDFIPGPAVLGATPPGRAGFYALVPFILGIHVGLPLIVMGIKGELFSPNNDLSRG